MAFPIIRNWYSNEQRLSPAARSYKVNASLCLGHITSLITVSVLETIGAMISVNSINCSWFIRMKRRNPSSWCRNKSKTILLYASFSSQSFINFQSQRLFTTLFSFGLSSTKSIMLFTIVIIFFLFRYYTF